MNFSKEEKKFWQTHYHFNKPSQLHENWKQIWSIDGNQDDDFFYFFSQRVTSIEEVHLKNSLISDRAVGYMTKFNALKDLYLRSHSSITKASIPFFNQMKHLETLNITKTRITLSDLCEHLNNQNLKTVFLDAEENEKDILEKGLILKEKMPNCNIYLNCSDAIDAFGNKEKPIF